MVCNNLGFDSLIKNKCYENMFKATVPTILKTLDSTGKKKRTENKKIKGESKSKLRDSKQVGNKYIQVKSVEKSKR